VRGRDILPSGLRTHTKPWDRAVRRRLGHPSTVFPDAKKTQPRMARLAASRQRPTASNHIKRTDF
jgi:hypothetical protein